MMILHPMIIILLLFSCTTEASKQTPTAAHAHTATVDSVPALADTAIGMDTNLAQATTTSIDTVPEDIYLRSVTIDGMAQPLFLKPKELVRLWNSNEITLVEEVTKGVFAFREEIDSRIPYFFKYLEFYSPSGVLMDRIDLSTLNAYYQIDSIKKVYSWYGEEGGRQYYKDSLGRFDEVLVNITPISAKGEFNAAIKVKIRNIKRYKGWSVADSWQFVYLDSIGRIIWDSGTHDELSSFQIIQNNEYIIASFFIDGYSKFYLSKVEEWPSKKLIPFMSGSKQFDSIGDDLVAITYFPTKSSKPSHKIVELYRLSTYEKLDSYNVSTFYQPLTTANRLRQENFTESEIRSFFEAEETKKDSNY